MPPLRFGIVGTGSMAQRFAEALLDEREVELFAVASRTPDRARSFLADRLIPNRFGSYEELFAHRQVDVVYVATPNAFHARHALAAIRAKKSVLIEKPFTTNVREAREVVGAARQNGVFLMEAMWTRFHPAFERALSWVSDGRIGELRLVEASFGFTAEPHELPALVSRQLAVGSLMDVGVYVLSLAEAFYGGAPKNVHGMANLSSGGADESAVFTAQFPKGGLLVGASAVTHETRHDVFLSGTRGRIVIEAPFWNPRVVRCWSANGSVETFEDTTTRSGLEHQIRAVVEGVRKGCVEDERMRWAQSISVMQTMDRLRQVMGVSFDGEDD